MKRNRDVRFISFFQYVLGRVFLLDKRAFFHLINHESKNTQEAMNNTLEITTIKE